MGRLRIVLILSNQINGVEINSRAEKLDWSGFNVALAIYDDPDTSESSGLSRLRAQLMTSNAKMNR